MVFDRDPTLSSPTSSPYAPDGGEVELRGTDGSSRARSDRFAFKQASDSDFKLKVTVVPPSAGAAEVRIAVYDESGVEPDEPFDPNQPWDPSQPWNPDQPWDPDNPDAPYDGGDEEEDGGGSGGGVVGDNCNGWSDDDPGNDDDSGMDNDGDNCDILNGW